MRGFLKKNWTILFIFVLWLLFSSPFFFLGKVPFAADYQVNSFAPWSMYSQFARPVKNGAMPDVITQIYPWRHVEINLWKSGQIPLWNIYSFSGTPLLANYQSAVLSPFNLLFFIFSFIDGWSLLILLQPILAGLGMYLFARFVKVSKVGSLLSSISFMFCGFMVVWMGYGTLGYALLFLPFALTGIEGFFSTQKRIYLFLLSFSLPLSFFSGHFQISIYVLITILLYWIFKSIQSKSLKLSAISGLYIFLGFMLCLPQILPSFEFYSQSLRSGLFQKGEVIPLGYLPTLVAPDFLGNPVTRNDWFGHYAEWNTYIGVIPFFLAIFALTAWKKTIVRFVFIVGTICLILALNTPVADVFVSIHIPVLSTSAMSRVVSIYSFFFALLAGFGLDSLVELINENKRKTVSAILFLGTLLFGILWIVILGKFYLPIDKISIAKQNLILPTILFGIMTSLLIGSFFFTKKIKKYIVFLLILITAFDMYRFATKWQAYEPKSLVTPSVPVIKEFEKIQGYARAIGNYTAEVSNYYQLPSLEGYDALYPKRYGEFVSYINDGYLHEADRSVVTFPKNGKYTSSALNLLNVEFVIHKVADSNRGWTFPYWDYPSNQFSMLFNDGVYQVYRNNFAYPHAFLVGDYTIEKDPTKILSMMFGKTNLRKNVVLEEKPSLKINEDAKASLKVNQYLSTNISVQTSTQKNMLLFLSDNYYPGWKAYIDGKETKILRADYTFRAVALPSGKHTVVFLYQPTSFSLGLGGFVIGLAGVLGITFFIKKQTKI